MSASRLDKPGGTSRWIKLLTEILLMCEQGNSYPASLLLAFLIRVFFVERISGRVLLQMLFKDFETSFTCYIFHGVVVEGKSSVCRTQPPGLSEDLRMTSRGASLEP